MKNVEPKVFIIGSTKVEPEGMRAWLDHIGAQNFVFPEPSTDGEKIVMAMGKRCYASFIPGLNPNVTKVREDMTAFIDNILSSRHGSVISHITYNFAIEGVSRVFTAEWNRHRVGVADGGMVEEDEELAISEGSMRYIRLTDIPWWIPDSLQATPEDSFTLILLKKATRELFSVAFEFSERQYQTLLEMWNLDNMPWRNPNDKEKAFTVKKKLTSCFRRIIPMGVATGGGWSGGIRALRNIFTQRCTPEAEEEILLVASLMLKAMKQHEPRLFADFEERDGFWYPLHYKV